MRRALVLFAWAFVLVTGLGMLAVLGRYVLQGQADGMGGPDGLVQAIQITDTILLFLSLGLAVLTIVTLYWLVAAVLIGTGRLVAARGPAGPVAFVHKIVALLVVAVFFRGTILALSDYLVRGVSNFFEKVPTDTARVLRMGLACIDSYREYDVGRIGTELCLSNIFVDTSAMVKDVAWALVSYSQLSRINLLSVAVMLIAFVGVAVAVQKVATDLRPARRFWVLYAGVASFALYLSLSALLAVPLFSAERAAPPRSADDLAAALQQMVPADIRTPETSPEGGPTLESALAMPPMAAEAPGAAVIEARLTDFAYQAALADSDLDGLDTDRTQFLETLDSQLAKHLAAGRDSFAVQLTARHGTREAMQHYLSIRDWFSVLTDEALVRAGDCEAAYQQVREAAADARAEIEGIVTTLPTAPAEIRGERFARIQWLLGDVQAAARWGSDSCSGALRAAGQPPERQNYGSFLGLAGAAASWLLQTESMQVTLITGLLGFGLLGALAAQFVRRPETGDGAAGDGPETAEEIGRRDLSDIAIVVFTGFVAAIVAYLASYGGLAIVSTEGGDPNPYIVFGACLVGAVFSNTIWQRAKGWFLPDGK